MKTPASRRRRIRSRRSSRRYGLAVALAAAVLFVVALMATMSGGRGNQAQTLANGLDSPVIFDGFPELASLDTTDTASERPVFRHSVIPGGVYTPTELKNALARDAVAASHYPSLKPEAVRAAVVTQDRFAYVSYRKDDQIYWTRNKVRLSAGETILTDGANEIRARCGNCISDTAMLPVADVEPDAAELDRLVDEGEQNHAGDPLLAAAVRSALESPGSNQNMLGGPGGSGPGDIAVVRTDREPRVEHRRGTISWPVWSRGVFRVWSIVWWWVAERGWRSAWRFPFIARSWELPWVRGPGAGRAGTYWRRTWRSVVGWSGWPIRASWNNASWNAPSRNQPTAGVRADVWTQSTVG